MSITRVSLKFTENEKSVKLHSHILKKECQRIIRILCCSNRHEFLSTKIDTLKLMTVLTSK